MVYIKLFVRNLATHLRSQIITESFNNFLMKAENKFLELLKGTTINYEEYINTMNRSYDWKTVYPEISLHQNITLINEIVQNKCMLESGATLYNYILKHGNINAPLISSFLQWSYHTEKGISGFEPIISNKYSESLIKFKNNLISSTIDNLVLEYTKAISDITLIDEITHSRILYAYSRYTCFNARDFIRVLETMIQFLNIGSKNQTHHSMSDVNHIIKFLLRHKHFPHAYDIGYNLFTSIKLGVRQSNIFAKLFESNASPNVPEKIAQFSLFVPNYTSAAEIENMIHWFVESPLMNETDSQQSNAIMLLDKITEIDFTDIQYLKHPIVTNLVDYLNKTPDFQASYASMTTRGQCECCKDFLVPIQITQSEYNNLKDSFFREVLQDKDIFLNTTPEEFKRYQSFLRNNDYDVVIDALNLCFMHSKTIQTRVLILQSAIDYFTNHKGRKVALFGRRHMLYWDKHLVGRPLQAIFKRYPTFLTDNASKDDPYLIYAALHKGLGTYILTKDLFRDHKFILTAPNHKTFERWRKMHSLFAIKVSHSGHLTLMPTLKYDINPQKNTKDDSITWHIPFQSGVPVKAFETLNTWICVTHKMQQK